MYFTLIFFRCDPNTTLSTGVNDSLTCRTVGNGVVSWTPRETPGCNRHCLLFPMDRGSVVLMHRPGTVEEQLFHIVLPDYGQLNQTANKMAVSSGIILPGGYVRHGAKLNISCNPGYQLDKPHTPVITCNSGYWSVRHKCVPGQFSCERICPSKLY